MHPLASILIPTYNSELWLAEALKSATTQTWENKEIIIVDDGSTDNTLEVANRYESPVVKIIRQENQGASTARNRALREAQGDFIQYLDADDLLSPQKIEEQVLLLQQNPPHMVAVCGTMYFFDGEDHNQGYLANGWPMVDSDDPLNWLIDLMGPDNNGSMVHPGAWLTPRDVADRAGFWNEMPSADDDGEYFARVVLSSKGIRRAYSGLSYYRKHQSISSLSRGRSETLQWGTLNSLDLKSHYILSRTNDPRAKRALARAYMERAVEAFPLYPQVTEAALCCVQELGGTKYSPGFGTWKGKLLCSLIGWKNTRRLNTLYHRLANRATDS
jgi:glycosyltransferase involved in cell wall biosynthesis